MNVTHTPGPWNRTNLTVHTVSTNTLGALGIARVFEAGIETEAADSVFQATANARLIAAAPEMFALLRGFAETAIPHEDGCICVRCEPVTTTRALLARIDKDTP